MRTAKLIEDFGKLANDAVSPTAHSVSRQTTASTFIVDGKKLVADLDKSVADYDADVAAVDYPNPAQTARRDELRTAVVTQLNRLAKRLNLDYSGNEVALLSSGLTMANGSGTAARSNHDLPAPTDVELVDSPTEGCLYLHGKRPAGAVQNLARYTTDKALPEENWLVAVGGGREMELGPFASGTKVWAKLASLTGSTSSPVYSAVVSRIVQ